MTLAVVETLENLRGVVAAWRDERQRVAVVPTMGALHEGHLSLVRAALAQADRVIVTIFVNPKQFNDPTDLMNYPRTPEEDAAKLSEVGAHLLYAPPEEQIYPRGFATVVSLKGMTECLCGVFRPGHFDGVATVVTKLLLQSGAEIAVFGEKDFQQLQVIRRLVSDLDIPVTVVGCPTVREADGLAMSSRNSRLSVEERKIAPKMVRILRSAAEKILAKTPPSEVIAQSMDEMLLAGFHAVDYLELRSEKDLSPLDRLDSGGRLFVAAWLGKTRLIDNVSLMEASRSMAR